MRAVVQRVDGASVVVDGETVGAIEGEGLCVLVGVTHEDTKEKAAQLARKLWSIWMLQDERSCSDIDAPLLVISQFTLYGDARKGRRPTWKGCGPRRPRRAAGRRGGRPAARAWRDGGDGPLRREDERVADQRRPVHRPAGDLSRGTRAVRLRARRRSPARRPSHRRSAARPPARSASPGPARPDPARDGVRTS